MSARVIRDVRPAAVMAGPPTGIWLGATAALRRTAPVDQPYPHICQTTTSVGSQRGRKDCAACQPAWRPATPATWPTCGGCRQPMDPAGTTDQNGDTHNRHPDCADVAPVIPFRHRPQPDQQKRRTA